MGFGALLGGVAGAFLGGPTGAAIGASIGGGLDGSDAAQSAADAQAGAANNATAAQERIFNKQTALQQPFRDVGLTANNRLAYLMGLDTGGGSTTRDQLRTQLLPQFTTTSTGWGAQPSVNEAALNAEIDKRMAADTATRQTTQSADPTYGSLARNFSTADFQSDPGYAFRMSEGMKGVENGAAARGGLLSGGALKAIQKYGQDLASTEYGNAYNRFTANQTNQYNRLSGLVNTGQGATNQISNAAQNFGNSQASNIMSAGNATASGIVGSQNAINSAIGQGYNIYQQNQLMNLIGNKQPNLGGGVWPG